MKLTELLQHTDAVHCRGAEDQEIRTFQTDSRKVGAGDLFIAVKGAVSDGHQFIGKALSQGATALLVEDVPEDVPEGVSVYQTKNARIASSYIASTFYKNPQDELTIIGITGTKGKTTTAGMLRAILNEGGIATGIIGSDGALFGEERIFTPNTTPDGPTLQMLFRTMADAGMTCVVMEVSSQAFKLHRVEGIPFDIGIFLNISPDHIGTNEHASYEEYKACKMKLFDQSRSMIVGMDSEIWGDLSPSQQETCISFSIDNHQADYYLEDFKPYREPGLLGSRFQVEGFLDGKITLAVPGLFNAANALAAIAASRLIGVDFSSIQTALRHFKTRGRAQIIPEAASYGRTVLLDFAHNAVSFKNILTSLRAYHPRKLVILYGLCSHETAMRGWDEGYNAGKYADLSIVTEDTEGSDPFDETMKDVIRALDETGGDYVVIPDRIDAIRYSLEHTNEEDILIYIGRSIDIFREKDGEKIPWTQEKVVGEILKEMYEED